MVESINSIIIGTRGSGKSCDGWSMLEQFNKEGSKTYFYMSPNPHLLKKVPFSVKNITKFSELHYLTDAAVLIDEANLFFDVLSKKVNQQLFKLLQLSRQNNLSLIFVIHDSYVFNRSLWTFIDSVLVKEVESDFWDTQRPFMKSRFSEVVVVGKENGYLWDRTKSQYVECTKPDWYSEELSLMFRHREEKKSLISALFKK